MNYFEAGDTFVPPHGPCEGHKVRVVNPDVTLWKHMELEAEGRKGKVQMAGFVPCVLVRCTRDRQSWSFPVELGKPDDIADLMPSPELMKKHIEILFRLLREAQDEPM